ncbi:Nif11-like leader peptide family natural product precursor [Streptomyces sp. NPDC001678]|uniref:Nif11-like leader peptide family natural product precursor n=1 Tax=Streptomyces sp. NPDC001678 TaxID=3364599 RepID=UPI0036885233
MPLKTCEEFLHDVHDPGLFRHEFKAVTAIEEVVVLGRRHGYGFTVAEFLEKARAFGAPGGDRPPAAPAGAGPTTVAHHEYELADLPGFAPVLAELPRLKTMPPTVDAARFAGDFRAEDLDSTSRNPTDPGYRAWHRRLAAAGWRDPGTPDAPRRDFHLVNLDEHVEHDGYEEYFAAKRRVVSALENVFDGEVRCSGSLWYPPNSYRLWHTNEDDPGWRMYVVDFDRPFDDDGRTSFFRYLHPRTQELVTLTERPRTVRFFKVSQDPEQLLWHCIVNPTDRHRWSFGFVVPENWMDGVRRNG